MRETAPGKDKVTPSAASARDVLACPPCDALPSILENMLNGVAYCRMLYEDGVPQDFIYLYTNPAFHEQTGLGPVCGKRVSEVIPGIRNADPQLFEIYGRVAAGGKPEKFETFLASLQAANAKLPDLFGEGAIIEAAAAFEAKLAECLEIYRDASAGLVPTERRVEQEMYA